MLSSKTLCNAEKAEQSLKGEGAKASAPYTPRAGLQIEQGKEPHTSFIQEEEEE